MHTDRHVVTAHQSLAHRIDAVLPQTQCTRCGYDDCNSYANAIANGDANINQCPPGGQEGVARIAAVTGQAVIALNPAHGVESARWTAVIDEAWCIGCTQCLPTCPTDAIVGANKVMHTVITAHCTGCALCLPACPVDCIKMENVSGQATGWAAWSQPEAQAAKKRYAQHQIRLVKQDVANASPAQRRLQGSTLADASKATPDGNHHPTDCGDAKQATIAAILEKARLRQATAQR